MKTTIDISDSLLQRSKELVRKERGTLKDLVEEGLQLAIGRREAQGRARVEAVTFGGEGLSEEYAERGWTAVRDAIYTGRGS